MLTLKLIDDIVNGLRGQDEFERPEFAPELDAFLKACGNSKAICEFFAESRKDKIFNAMTAALGIGYLIGLHSNDPEVAASETVEDNVPTQFFYTEN